MNILAVAGSLRAASSNASLVRAISDLAPGGFTVEVYGGLADIPPYSPDTDTESPSAAITALRTHVRAADGVLICTPEYAYGMPGLLKNALDWLVSSGDLYQKPVAALSASPSYLGGHRALAWLTQTLAAQHAEVPEGATFAVPFVRQVLDGDRVTDQELATRLRSALTALEAVSGAA